MNEGSPIARSGHGSCSRCGGATVISPSSGEVCLRCAGLRMLASEFGQEAETPGPGNAGTGFGQRIGPYEIIEELGQGGMGRVYAARQVGLGRIVALKAITVGRGTPPELEIRFLREAQTMARLRHPHIVAVHDSGRIEGCAYFSMEYIEGGDLAARLRTGAFDFRQSAELVRKVAGALAYAHGEGVLHRDIKPSNILMEGNEPRLADFGLAAQLEAGGGLTAINGILGTPHYLSPEAMSGGRDALTVASDVYALGVVLFEMLTGRTPFAGATPAELPTLLSGNDPPAPRLLAPGVPRDLETICLKCLDRDPSRRYRAAGALADDLGRFLAGERVLARPPSTFYLFRKFARRHRVALTAAGAVGVVLVAATAVSTWLAFRATQAERRAATEAATSREVTAFLQNDLLAQASPDQQPNRDLPLRTALDRAAAKIEERFRDRPLVAASLQATLASTYDSLGEYAAGQHHWERALALREHGGGPPDAATLSLMDQLATDLANQGKNREAESRAVSALRLMRQYLGKGHPVTLHAMNDLIFIHKQGGRLAQAESLAVETLDTARNALGAENSETRDAMINLASIYFSEGRLPKAESLNVEALALEKKVLGTDHPDTLVVMSNLASVFWAEGDLAKAEVLNRQILDIRRRVLGAEHPETLRSMHNLATTFRAEGRLADSAALERETLELRRRVMGPEHFDTLSSDLGLAVVCMDQGRLAEADRLLAPALETARRNLGPTHFMTLSMVGGMAGIRQKEGRLAESEQLFRELLAAREKQGGASGPMVLAALDGLGGVLLAGTKFAEAEATLRRSVAGHSRIHPDDWHTFAAQSALGAALAGLGRRAEAEELLTKASAGLKKRAASIPPNERAVVAETDARMTRLRAEMDQAGKTAVKTRVDSFSPKPSY